MKNRKKKKKTDNLSNQKYHFFLIILFIYAKLGNRRMEQFLHGGGWGVVTSGKGGDGDGELVNEGEFSANTVNTCM
jgi:hypothetical protein